MSVPDPSMVFTDRDGRRWIVVEYRGLNGQRHGVPIFNLRRSAADVEGRAFIPDGWKGDVRVYRFGAVTYRDTEPTTFQQQLDDARPVGNSPS